MLSKEKIDRINVLANKAKSQGLTEEEAREQSALRKEYLQAFRSNMLDTLTNTTFIDPEGTDVTPQKIKDRKNKRLH